MVCIAPVQNIVCYVTRSAMSTNLALLLVRPPEPSVQMAEFGGSTDLLFAVKQQTLRTASGKDWSPWTVVTGSLLAVLTGCQKGHSFSMTVPTLSSSPLSMLPTLA